MSGILFTPKECPSEKLGNRLVERETPVKHQGFCCALLSGDAAINFRVVRDFKTCYHSDENLSEAVVSDSLFDGGGGLELEHFNRRANAGRCS